MLMSSLVSDGLCVYQAPLPLSCPVKMDKDGLKSLNTLLHSLQVNMDSFDTNWGGRYFLRPQAKGSILTTGVVLLKSEIILQSA